MGKIDNVVARQNAAGGLLAFPDSNTGAKGNSANGQGVGEVRSKREDFEEGTSILYIDDERDMVDVTKTTQVDHVLKYTIQEL